MKCCAVISVLTLTILINGLITACGSPLLVVPQINYVSYTDLKAKEPDCTVQIDATEQAFINGSGIDQENACIETFRCYRSVWKYWENGYRILDSKVNTINREIR